jgi:hypothetical protein
MMPPGAWRRLIKVKQSLACKAWLRRDRRRGRVLERRLTVPRQDSIGYDERPGLYR